MSKSAENGFGAASRAVLGERRTFGCPNQIFIIANNGMEVCDGAHRLFVMKKTADRSRRHSGARQPFDPVSEEGNGSRRRGGRQQGTGAGVETAVKKKRVGGTLRSRGEISVSTRQWNPTLTSKGTTLGWGTRRSHPCTQRDYRIHHDLNGVLPSPLGCVENSVVPPGLESVPPLSQH